MTSHLVKGGRLGHPVYCYFIIRDGLDNHRHPVPHTWYARKNAYRIPGDMPIKNPE